MGHGTEKVRINCLGFVGIGTKAPYYPLEIVASANTENKSYRGFRYSEWGTNSGYR